MQPQDAYVPVVLTSGGYGADNCGVHTSRPLNVSGNGAVIDCAGTNRVLSSTSSLVMSDLVLQNGVAVDGDGGAVSIVTGDESPHFEFDGVYFFNNSAQGTDNCRQIREQQKLFVFVTNSCRWRRGVFEYDVQCCHCYVVWHEELCSVE